MVHILVHAPETLGVDHKRLHTREFGVIGVDDLAPEPEALRAGVNCRPHRETVALGPVEKNTVDEETLARPVLADDGNDG